MKHRVVIIGHYCVQQAAVDVTRSPHNLALSKRESLKVRSAGWLFAFSVLE